MVQRLGRTVADARLRAVEFRFAGDYREPLDPESLESDSGQLFCRVRKGTVSAQFGKIAMQQVEPWLVGLPRGPALALAGRRYRLIPSGATPPP